jgi:pSer/pThr/pTyr-binding forkhead associated (FHA) protein
MAVKPVPPAGKPPGKSVKPGAKVVVINGPPGFAGKVQPLATGKPTVVGRDPTAEVSIPSERISRRHCQFEPTEDGVFVLADLGSSNGTLVNQERLAGRKVLLGGEYIQVGDVLLRFMDS